MHRLLAEFRHECLLSIWPDTRNSPDTGYPVFSFYRISGKFAIRHIHRTRSLCGCCICCWHWNRRMSRVALSSFYFAEERRRRAMEGGAKRSSEHGGGSGQGAREVRSKGVDKKKLRRRKYRSDLDRIIFVHRAKLCLFHYLAWFVNKNIETCISWDCWRVFFSRDQVYCYIYVYCVCIYAIMHASKQIGSF